jgi:endo-1,4-beta-xylanase
LNHTSTIAVRPPTFGWARWALIAAFGGLLSGCDSGGHTELPAGASGGSAAAGSPSGGSGVGGAAGGSGGGAGIGGASAGGGSAGMTATGGAVTDSLAVRYAEYFPIGVAVSDAAMNDFEPLLAQEFNHLTCEYQMKIGFIHPAEDTYAWEETDRVADFARQHGMKLTGHTLLWHRDVPDWMFEGITAGDAPSLELLKSRLKAHIDAVVDRYADVVDNWDVVNEALSDDKAKTYRDGPEGSKWYELFGSEEYIYWAFKYAKDALEAKAAGSSAGKLYYNEYTATTKADKMLQMLAWLKDEKGLTIDGVGFQSHEVMTWPSASDVRTAIGKFKTAGYKVKISELDVSMYNDYSTGSFVASPAIEFTAEVEAKQAKRYADLFAVYRANRDVITSVTLWGVSDEQSWLNTSVPGRADFPLLYNAAHQPKAARAAILDF